MRIDEIVVNESYYEELLGVVQDQLSRAMVLGVEGISTPKFQKILFKLGYNISIPELIQAVDQSGFASSVDATTIRPTNQLPDYLASDAEDASEQELDIGKQGNSNAAQSIKQEKF